MFVPNFVLCTCIELLLDYISIYILFVFVSVLKIVKYNIFVDSYLGRPGNKIVKQTFRYCIKNHIKKSSNKSVTNRYLRGGAGLGGESENLNIQPTKNRIETGIKSY